MKYHIIEPEVIVGLGERTEFEEKTPPFLNVKKLHVNLEDWLGDDLVLISNCYLVTEKLKISLETSDFTGFEFTDVEITKDEYFDNNYQQEKALPKFYWMKIKGEKKKDDLYMDNIYLNASEPFLAYLKDNFQTRYLDVDPVFDKETDDFIMSLINRDKGLK